MFQIDIFTDGGSRGNPGPAAIGGVLFDRKKDNQDIPPQYQGVKPIFEIAQTIGVTTNNQAEYQALLAALLKASEIKAEDVRCFLDSELVVKQLKREYKVKDAGLAQIFIKIWNLRSQFSHIEFIAIRREKNKHADRLVNQALDNKEHQNMKS